MKALELGVSKDHTDRYSFSSCLGKTDSGAQSERLKIYKGMADCLIDVF